MLTLFFGHCKPLTKESDMYLKAQALTFTEAQQNTVSSCRGQPLPLSFGNLQERLRCGFQNHCPLAQLCRHWSQ